MDARPVAITGRLKSLPPLIAAKTNTCNRFSIRTYRSADSKQVKVRQNQHLRKKRGRVVLLLTGIPKRELRLFTSYPYFVTSLLLYFASPSYTHSLSLHPRSHKC
jgi:hypothetical protein